MTRKTRLLPWAAALVLACTACAGQGPDRMPARTQPPATALPAATPPQTQTPPAEESPQGETDPGPGERVDLDLSPLSGTVAYAELCSMLLAPQEYSGKIIRMKGTFTAYQDPVSKRVYCGITVLDAAACCAQGFDIEMPAGSAYPDDYPVNGEEVTVVGRIQQDETLAAVGIASLRLLDVTFENTAP